MKNPVVHIMTPSMRKKEIYYECHYLLKRPEIISNLPHIGKFISEMRIIFKILYTR